MTTRPFSRWRVARCRMYGSAIRFISIAVCTRTGTPRCSSASASASALIVVASMPIWSARVRSILPPPSLTPRQKLPPPTTTPISQPLFVTFLDHITNRPDYIEIQAKVLIPRKRLAADFDQHALIFRCCHVLHSLLHIPAFYSTLSPPVLQRVFKIFRRKLRLIWICTHIVYNFPLDSRRRQMYYCIVHLIH